MKKELKNFDAPHFGYKESDYSIGALIDLGYDVKDILLNSKKNIKERLIEIKEYIDNDKHIVDKRLNTFFSNNVFLNIEDIKKLKNNGVSLEIIQFIGVNIPVLDLKNAGFKISDFLNNEIFSIALNTYTKEEIKEELSVDYYDYKISDDFYGIKGKREKELKTKLQNVIILIRKLDLDFKVLIEKKYELNDLIKYTDITEKEINLFKKSEKEFVISLEDTQKEFLSKFDKLHNILEGNKVTEVFGLFNDFAYKMLGIVPPNSQKGDSNKEIRKRIFF
jgi:hypothetical protein